MKTEHVTKPENISEQTWIENQRWIQLMSAEAESHRHNRDPRLYRQSAQQLITPPDPK